MAIFGKGVRVFCNGIEMTGFISFKPSYSYCPTWVINNSIATVYLRKLKESITAGLN
jgi:hypothetical protein